MLNKRELGNNKESVAAEFLRKKNYEILHRNFRCRTGEIDIVAKDGEYIVFCEVKYRSGIGFGFPEEAVDGRKQNKIRRVAQYFLTKYNINQTLVRFDVIAILGNEIKHIRNAF